MRPIIGADALASRSRKSSSTELPIIESPAPGHGPSTTFFLAREDEMGQSSASSRADGSDSNYGVRSLEDTLAALSTNSIKDKKTEREEASDRGRRRSIIKASETLALSGHSPAQAPSPCPSSNPSDHPSDQANLPQSSEVILSDPLTPLLLASPVYGSSVPSSPKSMSSHYLKQGDEDAITEDSASQDNTSSSGEEEEDHQEHEEEVQASREIQDSEPQLIMPSIKMPSRRPFTQRGKSLGRLKVLVAGNSSVGKTSLIRSIVQTCEDIVHVDPLTPSQPTLPGPQHKRPSGRTSGKGFTSTTQVSEIYASTRPYPPWWSDLEGIKPFKRRKSMEEAVLERNICFVDTPGYSHGMSLMEGVQTTVKYIELQLQRTAQAFDTGNSDLVSMASGDGGSQVDVVFYVMDNRIREVDVECLRRLSSLTNIIPLISKSDLRSHDELISLKKEVLGRLRAADVHPFLFGKSFDDIQEKAEPTFPFAISSANGDDSDNMDASLLMSSGYVPPLTTSELSTFVDQVFQQDTVAWLRHSSAKKLLNWRRRKGVNLVSGFHPLSSFSSRGQGANLLNSATPSLSYSSPSRSQVIVPYNYGSADRSTYGMASFMDHTRREERLAQVRLSKWAVDLQRSLQNERERYEALARGDRALWLTERLGECVMDGTIVPVRRFQGPGSVVSDNGFGIGMAKNGAIFGINARNGLMNPMDPLGLLQWDECLKQRGLLALEIIGSFGIIGGLAFWLAKSWGWTSQGNLAEWHWLGGTD
ncbi:MAG: hypothetical protein M1834_000665 [Cirrosporium novae-zelandiae]|nr:MAG: hypothetical protein M1834_000665 [Cirrosporium novae-zelandiae]